jgi:alpha-L-fucosidase
MNKEEINKKFNELSWEIEKFPASHLQTSISLMVAKLRSYFSNYCDDVSDKYLLSVSEKAREILCARILELEENIARYQKRDEVWRNKYALVQDDLARAFETIEKLEGRIVIDEPMLER